MTGACADNRDPNGIKDVGSKRPDALRMRRGVLRQLGAHAVHCFRGPGLDKHAGERQWLAVGFTGTFDEIQLLR